MASLALPLISGLAGLFGEGPQKSATSQQSSGTQTTNGTTSSNTSPELSSEQQQLANQFGEGLMNQYNQGVDLNPYKAQGLQNIQSGNQAAQKATDNMIASRGLSFSPAAATAQTAQNINSGNQTSSFLNSLPLLQHQLTQQNIQGLISGFSALPTAVSSNGQNNQTQTSNTSTTGNGALSGNPTAGLFSGVGAGLAASGFPSLANSLGGKWGGVPGVDPSNISTPNFTSGPQGPPSGFNEFGGQ